MINRLLANLLANDQKELLSQPLLDLIKAIILYVWVSIKY